MDAPLPAALLDFAPDTGIVLGSGLADLPDRLNVVDRIPAADLGLPVSGVPGHRSDLILADSGPVRFALLTGRVHLYEGRSPAEVTAGVRLMAAAGVRRIVLTNAAGSLNPDFAPGSWMMLADHLNLTGTSPLAGPQFLDLTDTYSAPLRQRFSDAARAAGIPLHHGVYAGLRGPQYETPAEIRMLRTLGADAVGMSTVLEAIQARALDLEVAAFSCLTNWAAGIAGPLSHDDVLAAGRHAGRSLCDLLAAALAPPPPRPNHSLDDSASPR